MILHSLSERRRKLLAGAGALAFCGAWPDRATAKDGRPIRLIMPFSSGGPTDAVARTIAAAMSTHLGVPIVVDNKAGANGVIAADYVAKAPPDGTTLLYHTSAFTLGAALTAKLPYDPLKDFTYIGMTTSVPLVLLVRADFPANDPKQFIAELRASPDKHSYGCVLRSIVHIAPEQMFLTLGVKATPIPYKGTAPAVVDLIGGQIQFAFDAVNSALPHIQGGKVKAIGVASLKRITVLPDVPTFDETVLPGFQAGTWGGIMAPRNTPPDIVEPIHKALLATLAEPAIRQQFESQGQQIIGSSPEQYASFVRDEIQRWQKVVAAINIPLD